MRQDLLTVIWKESIGFFRTKEKRYQTLMTLLIPLVFFGVILPWQTGILWLEGFHPILAAVALPMVMAMLTAPDSFAGERERNTLPTLLASRLPDGAILWGKVLWNLALAWGLTLAVLILGWAASNVAIWDGSPAFYGPKVAVASFGFSFLMALFSVGVSIPVSLRASTVQEAMHTMSAILLLPPIVGIVILIVLKNVNPAWSVEVYLARIDLGWLLGLILVIFALVDGALLIWARKTFRRSRLIATGR